MINGEVWFLFLAYLQLLNLGASVIIIMILLYNIIKRTERIKTTQNENERKIGFNK